MILKHNHLSVSRAFAAKRKQIPQLMVLEGKFMTTNVPYTPHPPEFFDSITVPVDLLPAAPESKFM